MAHTCILKALAKVLLQETGHGIDLIPPFSSLHSVLQFDTNNCSAPLPKPVDLFLGSQGALHCMGMVFMQAS